MKASVDVNGRIGIFKLSESGSRVGALSSMVVMGREPKQLVCVLVNGICV